MLARSLWPHICLMIVILHLTFAKAESPLAGSSQDTDGKIPPKSVVDLDNILNSFTIEYIDSLILRDLSAPDTYNCLNDEIAVGMYANATNNNLLYSMTILNVTQYDAQDVVDAYVTNHAVNVLQGIAPSSLVNISGFILVDPVYPFPRLHWHNPNVVYFFPIMEQEFYVFAMFLSANTAHLPSKILAVINTETEADNQAALASLAQCMGNFSLGFDHVITTSSVVDSLSPDSTNVIVGLRSNDVASLLSFLTANPLAVVLLLFDDLTIQYNVIHATFANASLDVTDRIIFTTNLPIWTHYSDDHDVAMIVFFENFGKPYHTPATLRAYFTMLMLDDLTSHTRTTPSLRDALYQNSEMGVDHTVMGNFADVCPYPTTEPLSCLVNFGAQNLNVWSYSTVVSPHRLPLAGPITPPVSFFTQTEDLRRLSAEPRTTMVGFLTGVMAAMLIALTVLAILCIGGFFDDVQSVVTVVHVSVDYTNKGNSISIFRIQEVLQQYADAVDTLVEKHHAMQLESNHKSFTLATRKAQSAVLLAQDLIFSVKHLKPHLPNGTTVGLRIGIHTGSCNCARAIDENDADALSIAAAPLKMLAQCVGELCGPNEVLITGWTHNELYDNLLASSCRPHSRNQLDDESTVIDVYRYAPPVAGVVESSLREFSLLSIGSMSRRQKHISNESSSPIAGPTLTLDSTLDRSNRLNTLGLNLMGIAEESSDEMSSHMMDYEI